MNERDQIDWTQDRLLDEDDVLGVDWGKIGKEIGQGAAGAGLLVGKPILNAFGMSSTANAVQAFQMQHGVLPDWAISASAKINAPNYVVINLHGNPTPFVGQNVKSMSIYGGTAIPGNGYVAGQPIGNTYSGGATKPIRVDLLLQSGKKKSLLNVDQVLYLGGTQGSTGSQVTSISNKAGGVIAVAAPLLARGMGGAPSTANAATQLATNAQQSQASLPAVPQTQLAQPTLSLSQLRSTGGLATPTQQSSSVAPVSTPAAAASAPTALNLPDVSASNFQLNAPSLSLPASSTPGLTLDSSTDDSSSTSDDVSFDGGNMSSILGDNSDPFDDGTSTALPVVPASQAPPPSPALIAAVQQALANQQASQQALTAFQSAPPVAVTNPYYTSAAPNDFSQRLAAERQFVNSYVNGDSEMGDNDLDVLDDEVLGELNTIDDDEDSGDVEIISPLDGDLRVRGDAQGYVSIIGGLTDAQRAKLKKYLDGLLRQGKPITSTNTVSGLDSIVGGLTDAQRAKLKKYLDGLLRQGKSITSTVSGGGDYDSSILGQDNYDVDINGDLVPGSDHPDNGGDYVLGSHVLGAPLLSPISLAAAAKAPVVPARAGFIPAISVGGNPIAAHVVTAPTLTRKPLVPAVTTKINVIGNLKIPTRKFSRPARTLADKHMDSIKNAQDAGNHAVSIGKKLLAAAGSSTVNVHGEVLGAISRAPRLTVTQIKAHANAAIKAGNNAISAATKHLKTLQSMPILPNPYRTSTKTLPMSVMGEEDFDRVFGDMDPMDAYDVLGAFANAASLTTSSEDTYGPPPGTVLPGATGATMDPTTFASMVDPMTGVPYSQETDPNTGMPYTVDSVDPNTGVPFSQDSAGATSAYPQPPYYGVAGPPTATAPGVAMVSGVDFDPDPTGAAASDGAVYSSDPNINIPGLQVSSPLPNGIIQVQPLSQGSPQDIQGTGGATWWFGSADVWNNTHHYQGSFGKGFVYEKGNWAPLGSTDQKAATPAQAAGGSYYLAQLTAISLTSFKDKGQDVNCGPLIARPGMPVNNARCDIAAGQGKTDIGTYGGNNQAGAPSGSYAWWYYWDTAPASAQAPILAARLQQANVDFQAAVAAAAANTAAQIASDQLSTQQAAQLAKQQATESAATAYQYQQEQADAQNQAQLQAIADSQADQEQQSQDSSAARMAQAQAQVQATQEQADANAAATQYAAQAQVQMQAMQQIQQLAQTDPATAAALAAQYGITLDSNGNPVVDDGSSDGGDDGSDDGSGDGSDYDRNQLSSSYDPNSNGDEDDFSSADAAYQNGPQIAQAMDNDEY